MREVDALIILGRENSWGALAWQRALTEVRLHSRIAAICKSAAPEQPSSIPASSSAKKRALELISGLSQSNLP
jgi:hypothetical protein